MKHIEERCRDEVKDIVASFRQGEAANPTWPRFNEATLPPRGNKHVIFWAAQCLDVCRAWADHVRRHARGEAVLKLGTIAAITSINEIES